MNVQCPKCGYIFKRDNILRVKCPKCGSELEIDVLSKEQEIATVSVIENANETEEDKRIDFLISKVERLRYHWWGTVEKGKKLRENKDERFSEYLYGKAVGSAETYSNVLGLLRKAKYGQL